MKNRERALNEFVLEAMVNDYESFQCILEQVTKWSGQKGLHIQKVEVAGAVERAIRDGHALANFLSPQPPHSQVAEFSIDRLDELWFYVTPKGTEFVKTLGWTTSSPS